MPGRSTPTTCMTPQIDDALDGAVAGDLAEAPDEFLLPSREYPQRAGPVRRAGDRNPAGAECRAASDGVWAMSPRPMP